MKRIAGIAASDGIAIAPVYLLTEPDLSFDEVTVDSTDKELERFKQAVQQTQEELTQLRAHTAQTIGEEEAQVFDAHLLFIEDPEFIGPIEDKIKETHCNAESALKTVAQMMITLFEGMHDNPYMQERATDIKDVYERLLAALLGVQLPSPSTIDQEVIVVAVDLTPSDTAQLNKAYVQAFVTNIGGRTSHSAIMARSLEIPAIVGTQDITEHVQNGDWLIVDAVEGEVILKPTEEELALYRDKQVALEADRKELEKLVHAASETKDQHSVELAANIGTPRDVHAAIDHGAEAIGLYRTEFLYMDSEDFPSEEEQFNAYKEVLEAMKDQPVIVRTMDIGGDKELPYLHLPEEMNPFLGYRAIRISLDQTAMFRTQLRALIRASAYGTLRIMFPMIATLDEFRQAKAIFEEEKAKLKEENIPHAANIEVGIMVEIPATALLADQFAKEVDFFSIGTNDLIQYSMAADRMNERVSYLYQPLNPSILRLIHGVITASHKAGIWTGMCGEMGGDLQAIPLLLGMGLDEFSMSSSSILKARRLIRQLDHREMQELAHKALTEAGTAEDVYELLKEHVNIK